MSTQQYLENLEALRANADVVDALVSVMDEALERPSYAYEGQLETAGAWNQTAGPDSAIMTDRSRIACRDFWQGDLVHLQTQQALVQTSFTGIPQRNESANYAAVLRPVEGLEWAASVRRCGLVGLYGFTHHRTAEQYRVEVPMADVTYIMMLTRLGNTVVHAEEHLRPTQTNNFGRRCQDEFADPDAVEALMTGDFSTTEQLDVLVGRLNAAPEQAELVGQLRAQALSTKQGSQFAHEFNLYMPSRDKFQGMADVVRRLFIAS